MTQIKGNGLRNDDGELMYVSDREQICQATFKNHCQYPKCDCDRTVKWEVIEDIMDVLDGPEQECYPLVYVTDPAHGGKVTCHKCNGFIAEDDDLGYMDHQHTNEFPLIHFHKKCYNGYEHYYGLDRGID